MLLAVLFNFCLCVGMSFALRAFYIQRSFSLTGKYHIASIIPILSSVVFLVIVIVKSSLALSLGLVGALSIVRFRTPIKEPEELVYLFLAIAIGLGYAAGHSLLTTIIVILIMIVSYIWLSNRKFSASIEYNMVVAWQDDVFSLEVLINKISSAFSTVKLVRFDAGKSGKTAVFIISSGGEMNLTKFAEELKSLHDNTSISFYEAKTNW